jgi:3-(3-hydroxy-phenyl)propionate hydroxylase
VYETGDHGGRISEQPRLDQGYLLDDQVGYHSAVLAHPDLAAALARQGADLKIVPATSPAALAWLDRLGGSAVVLRPDRYIFGVAQTERDVKALMARYAAARRRHVLAA